MEKPESDPLLPKLCESITMESCTSEYERSTFAEFKKKTNWACILGSTALGIMVVVVIVSIFVGGTIAGNPQIPACHVKFQTSSKKMRFQERHYPGTGDEWDPLLNVSSAHRQRSKAIRLAVIVTLSAAACTLLLIFLLAAGSKDSISPPLNPPVAPPLAPQVNPVSPPVSPPAPTPGAPSEPPPAAPTGPLSLAQPVSPDPETAAPVVMPLLIPSPTAAPSSTVPPIRELIPGHDWKEKQ
ncbi:unnamed protein product [Allacma fusca]|uniref:Uncharacterized protein n=1 Tax=Allacma fusca TaxID=39272 RepID=A0A8J2K9I9_9HEXA|nr:unnamed protein product [Allacma fusca]